ncbi:8687_t:CDS:2 [Funneliformis geosporum]|uniref:Protein YIF1 n=1 Tax=Funneliformis geosporum TaxID=1117311 RepID=A0A9W4SNX0_9GLOM|nr:8687_t:CDS:2 [Funneliformis geosporum]CAI2175959.1 4536_t:CDS:2 [Funneliformis geosporum]
MYNPNNPPKQKPPPSYTYYPQQHSVSPPPLQHPIPTHPPIQMQGPNEYNDAWKFNDATTQMGMQFGRTAMMAGSEYVEKNINRYVNFPALKHYFKVNNLYVANKIRLLLFPWRHRPWSRLVKRSEQNGQMEGFKPPRDDINSPDLYIPAMALVTYVLLTGFVAGTEQKFHPEVLGVNATTASLVMVLELVLIKMGCYLLNITTETQIFDLLAYSGYKFIGIIVTLLVGLIAPFWMEVVIFVYTASANGFFLLRSLRYVVFPDSTNTNTVNSPQRKKRIYFLFVVASLQLILMYLLI